jgi:demethylmenaquinone methyltransferase / 2-methoxy-6-polyprenyl-1,4-benzoquinol methylase
MITGTELAERFFSSNGTTYDQIANLSTLGLDTWWKKLILDKVPKSSTQILDQACGTGILTFKIARKFPHCRVIGVDLQDEYIRIARQKAKDLRLTNIEFISGRAEDVILDGCFDCITSSYLAKYADLNRLIENARGMLRDDGVLIIHELTCPANPVLASLWKLNFKFLQTYGAWKYPEWETAFRELPAVLEETNWVNELTEILKANEFSSINTASLTFEASAIVTARKTPMPPLQSKAS